MSGLVEVGQDVRNWRMGKKCLSLYSTNLQCCSMSDEDGAIQCTNGIRLVKETPQYHPPCKVDCVRGVSKPCTFLHRREDPINRQLHAVPEDVACRIVRIRGFEEVGSCGEESVLVTVSTRR